MVDQGDGGRLGRCSARGLDLGDSGGARFRFEAAFPTVSEDERGRPLAGRALAIQTPDAFVRAAAVAQIEASGGAAAEAAAVTLVDHAMAATEG
ncbi:MAG: hybrid sensor histidine kinase/response regulator, partial [Brevundimonas sp.]